MLKRLMISGAAAVAMTSSVLAADIVDTASQAGNFTTLLAAAEAAGLVETLKGDGPFTVFAPTDDAFAALPAGTVDDLLKEENRDQLVSILTYHVVPGSVASSDLTEGMTAATVQGSDVTFTLEGGAKVNDANITQADIEADTVSYTSSTLSSCPQCDVFEGPLSRGPQPRDRNRLRLAHTETGGLGEYRGGGRFDRRNRQGAARSA